MPLLIVVVVAIAAFVVDRLHGVFGKTEITREGSGLANDPKPFNPKSVTYEIFGPTGTVATINYLNLDAEPQIARNVTLPWSLTLTTTAPAAGANIVAQGDSDTIGCRITIDGVLKDEDLQRGQCSDLLPRQVRMITFSGGATRRLTARRGRTSRRGSAGWRCRSFSAGWP